MQKSRISHKNFQVATSRGARSPHTLALQVAKALERQQEVGARLRKLRGPRPQPVIADAVGVTLRAYHAWEAGESGIAWRNLHRLAEFHGVSENYLLYGAEEPRGPQGQLDRIEAKLDQLLELQFEQGLTEADELDEPQDSESEEGDDESEGTGTD